MMGLFLVTGCVCGNGRLSDTLHAAGLRAAGLVKAGETAAVGLGFKGTHGVCIKFLIR